MSQVLVNVSTTTTAAPPTSMSLTNVSLAQSSVGEKAARATFLSLFIIVGFVGNSVLIATIAQSSRLKSSTINLCILSLSVANILDTAANMPLILGATITEKWDYGSFACHLNAFGLQLVSVVVIVGLMVLTLDRAIAISEQPNQKRLTQKRISIVIVFTWVHAVAFSIPLMFDSVVPIKVFPVRYLCTISTNTPLVYLCLTSIFAYLIPACMCFGLFIYIIQKAVRQKKHDKKQRSRADYVEGSLPKSRMWAEMEGAKYAGVLFILWCILQAPYLVLSSIMWYKNSTELAGVSSVTDFLHFTYPWELELALTWLKLSYPGFLPAVTFLWKKEVWQKFKNTVLCRKSNLVIDASPHVSPDHKRDNALSSSNGVPVLFATENGLHFQTFNDEDDCSDEIDPDTEIRDNPNTQIVTTTTKCDVYGSQDFLQLDEDTSDYDSSGEIDPFSTSNPLSVRTEYGQQRSQTSSNNSKLSASQNRIISAPKTEESDATKNGKYTEEDIQETKTVKEHTRKSSRNKQNNSSSSLRDTIAGETNHAVVIEEEEGIDLDPEPMFESVSMERTSHDSGMGSLETNKKAAVRKYKPKKPPNEPAEHESPPNNIVEQNQPKATKKDANLGDQQVSEDVTSAVPKKRRKPRQSSVSESESNNTVDAVKMNYRDDTEPHAEKLVTKPVPAPRKSLLARAISSPADTTTVEQPSVETKPSEKKKRPKSKDTNDIIKTNHKDDNQNTIDFKQKPTKDAETLSDVCVAKGLKETLPDDKNIQKIHTNEWVKSELDVKPKKKKKKKIVDPEVRRKKLEEDLDQEIQGVLY